ncbi:MAG: serpin family protein [Deltaproteobacteria bacterium]|nr:serpin family protein [Deltaproteobacteria bacterium]
MKTHLVLAFVGLVLVSCTSATTPELNGPQPPGQEVASSLSRDTAPDTTAEELAQLTGDNAAFGWELYREIVKDGDNLFFSPHSISVALAMTWAGARGNTETEMADALHFVLGQERLHPAFNSLDLELATRAEASGANAPLPFRLNVTNALFGQVDFAFLDPFLDTLAVNYGAGMRLMDFVNETEQSRVAINAWVADKTEDRIEELIPQGVVDAATRLVLVNAIYFKASWAEPFDEANTTDDPFTLLDDTEITAPTMHGFVPTGYADGPNYRAAELPYDGQQLAMLLIVPDAGQFAAVESALSASTVAQIRDDLTGHQVEFALPKFSFRSQVPARAPLMSLGMVDAFGSGADLSGMNGTGRLFIQDVVHEAFIAIDEKGTEAAAATAVVVGETSAPPAATLTVDRPFMFAIIDRPTGATLFIGRVVDPSN